MIAVNVNYTFLIYDYFVGCRKERVLGLSIAGLCVCFFFRRCLCSRTYRSALYSIIHLLPMIMDNTNCYFQINHNFFPLSMLDTLTSSSISPMRIRKKKYKCNAFVICLCRTCTACSRVYCMSVMKSGAFITWYVRTYVD